MQIFSSPLRFADRFRGLFVYDNRIINGLWDEGKIFMIYGSERFLEVVAFQDSAKLLLNSKVRDKLIIEI